MYAPVRSSSNLQNFYRDLSNIMYDYHIHSEHDVFELSDTVRYG